MMNDHKTKSLELKERYAFLIFIVAIAFTVSTGHLIGTLVVFGFAILFKFYMYFQYKKADLLSDYWKKSSMAGLGAGIIVIVLAMMSYFDLRLF